MKKVAIVGIQGVPAKYGGFETLVENIIGENCSANIQYTVFCSSKDYAEKLPSYKGALLKYIPVHANGMQSTIYDILSLLKVIRGYDVVMILGVSGCAFLPVFRLFYKKKLIVNIDGLEHQRAKWGKFAKWFLRLSEALAVRYADVIVADNKAIKDYVWKTYRKESVLIAYGGEHAVRKIDSMTEKNILEKYQLTSQNYALSICRIEPENNCHISLEAFAQSGERLVFIGNWEISEYGEILKAQYSVYPHILILDAIYDLDVLYVLRKNCKCYIHGHSAGGTNPSLVEAMFLAPVLAYDVIYNRETTENKADYFTDTKDLIPLLRKNREEIRMNATSMFEIANQNYVWSKIAKLYEEIIHVNFT
ncbi:rhamnosyltransferase [Bacteroidia bacterium]|nr:rhamnosyltransferase [Bacteroidia bacterium]GHV07490.1 rhamnosyltransferase [Bacteroidia bacterium]